MPKLAISREDWLGAAVDGKIARLNDWAASGMLGTSGKRTPERAPIFDVSDQDKEGALHKAIKYGQEDYALRLLQIGVFADARNSTGETPLMLAAQSGKIKILRELVSLGHKIDRVNNAGMNALLLALTQKKEAAALFLIEKGASVASSAATNPLLIAVRNESIALLKKLLEKGADPNMQGEGGAPFHCLAARWTKEDSEGETVLRQMMRILIRAGADTEQPKLLRNGSKESMEDCFFYEPGYRETLPQEVARYQAERMEQETAKVSPQIKSASPRL